MNLEQVLEHIRMRKTRILARERKVYRKRSFSIQSRTVHAEETGCLYSPECREGLSDTSACDDTDPCRVVDAWYLLERLCKR